jgi:phosphoglycolate phosphatase-like HAD superfamily hydrolase
MTKPLITTLVLDLDNTLWDWVEIWYQSFSAMLRTMSDTSGIPDAELRPHIRAVHQRHGTAEYAFLLDELDVLPCPPEQTRAEAYVEAVEAYRSARRAALALYPGVAETLDTINAAGCRVLAYTESMAFYTNYRIRKLDLDGRIHVVYSPADHDLPRGLSEEQVRKYPKDHYELKHTTQQHTPAGEKKPNPAILRSIMRDAGADPKATAFVGDSLMKDIAMAQDCGIMDVHAEYGKAQNRPEYQLLKDVTHWSDEEVERERATIADSLVTPTYVLKSSFPELLDLFEFGNVAGTP